MRRLIWYIRSCFCKHDWEQIFNSDIYWSEKSTRPYKRERFIAVRNVAVRKDI